MKKLQEILNEVKEIIEANELSLIIYDFANIDDAVKATKKNTISVSGTDKKGKKVIKQIELKDGKQAELLMNNINNKKSDLNKMLGKKVSNMKMIGETVDFAKQLLEFCETNEIQELTEEIKESQREIYKEKVLESDEYKELVKLKLEELKLDELDETTLNELYEACEKKKEKIPEEGCEDEDELEENYLESAMVHISKNDTASAIDSFKKAFLVELGNHPDYIAMSEEMDFLKESEMTYKEFFTSKLKKYGVKEPDELADDEKKKFYDEIDAEWEGEKETPEDK